MNIRMLKGEDGQPIAFIDVDNLDFICKNLDKGKEFTVIATKSKGEIACDLAIHTVAEQLLL
jgi:hypothetical protein